MILISGKLFGFIALGTVHIALPIDLPVLHFSGSLGSVLAYDVTTGPRSLAAPSHSVQAVQVQETEVAHDAPDPRIVSGNWN